MVSALLLLSLALSGVGGRQLLYHKPGQGVEPLRSIVSFSHRRCREACGNHQLCRSSTWSRVSSQCTMYHSLVDPGQAVHDPNIVWMDDQPDVNECVLDEAVCGRDATCVNTDGSYLCYCQKGGTVLDSRGFDCIDLNECHSGAHACDGVGTCQNTEGSYYCTCPAGYNLGLDGRTCEGITCDSDPCEPGHVCLDMPPPHTCQDVDECLDQSACTFAHEVCTNTPGSFECTCADEYQAGPYTLLTPTGVRPVGPPTRLRVTALTSHQDHPDFLEWMVDGRDDTGYEGSLTSSDWVQFSIQPAAVDHVRVMTSGESMRGATVWIEDSAEESSSKMCGSLPVGHQTWFTVKCHGMTGDRVTLRTAGRLEDQSLQNHPISISEIQFFGQPAKMDEVDLPIEEASILETESSGSASQVFDVAKIADGEHQTNFLEYAGFRSEPGNALSWAMVTFAPSEVHSVQLLTRGAGQLLAGARVSVCSGSRCHLCGSVEGSVGASWTGVACHGMLGSSVKIHTTPYLDLLEIGEILVYRYSSSYEVQISAVADSGGAPITQLTDAVELGDSSSGGTCVSVSPPDGIFRISLVQSTEVGFVELLPDLQDTDGMGLDVELCDGDNCGACGSVGLRGVDGLRGGVWRTVHCQNKTVADTILITPNGTSASLCQVRVMPAGFDTIAVESSIEADGGSVLVGRDGDSHVVSFQPSVVHAVMLSVSGGGGGGQASYSRLTPAPATTADVVRGEAINVYYNSDNYAPEKAIDGLYESLSDCYVSKSNPASWLELHFAEPKPIEVVRIQGRPAAQIQSTDIAVLACISENNCKYCGKTPEVTFGTRWINIFCAGEVAAFVRFQTQRTGYMTICEVELQPKSPRWQTATNDDIQEILSIAEFGTGISYSRHNLVDGSLHSPGDTYSAGHHRSSGTEEKAWLELHFNETKPVDMLYFSARPGYPSEAANLVVSGCRRDPERCSVCGRGKSVMAGGEVDAVSCGGAPTDFLRVVQDVLASPIGIMEIELTHRSNAGECSATSTGEMACPTNRYFPLQAWRHEGSDTSTPFARWDIPERSLPGLVAVPETAFWVRDSPAWGFQAIEMHGSGRCDSCNDWYPSGRSVTQPLATAFVCTDQKACLGFTSYALCEGSEGTEINSSGACADGILLLQFFSGRHSQRQDYHCESGQQIAIPSSAGSHLEGNYDTFARCLREVTTRAAETGEDRAGAYWARPGNSNENECYMAEGQTGITSNDDAYLNCYLGATRSVKVSVCDKGRGCVYCDTLDNPTMGQWSRVRCGALVGNQVKLQFTTYDDFVLPIEDIKVLGSRMSPQLVQESEVAVVSGISSSVLAGWETAAALSASYADDSWTTAMVGVGSLGCFHSAEEADQWARFFLSWRTRVSTVWILNRFHSDAPTEIGDRLVGSTVDVCTGAATPPDCTQCEAAAVSAAPPGVWVAVRCDATGDTVHVTGSSQSLTICEISVVGTPPEWHQLTPLAASESSVNGEDRGAANALDGILTTSYFCPSFLHTEDQPGEWVEFLLETSSSISEVAILTRQDCCWGRMEGLQVDVCREDPTSAGVATCDVCGILLYDAEAGGGPWHTVHCFWQARGTSVRLSHPGVHIIELAEIFIAGHA